MSHEEFPTDHPAVVTVGLPYANGDLHVGHLRGYVAGDVFARALRRVGQRTAFVCGSDMHGTPIVVNAQEEGVSPEEFALRWHETYEETFPQFNVEFDHYGHTHEETNQEITREIVRTLDEAGHVYDKEIKVAWDPQADQPLPDRFVEGTCPYCGAEARGDECDEGCQRHLEPGEIEDPHSVITGNPAEYRERRHKFFRLSSFQEYLQGFIDRLEGTQNARSQPREWIEGELQDWCITRDLDWGIDYPGEDGDGEDLVLYVWVDAPVEYIASTRQYSEAVGADVYDWTTPWRDGEGEIVHVIGRDIIQHHTVFWPAMLEGAGYNEPRAVMASGIVNLDGRSFSTSRNRAVWADEYLDAGFHPDLYRYYIVTGSGFEKDVDFSWSRFAERVNAELVGTLGNFLYRSLLFAHRNYDGTPGVPADEEGDAPVSDAVREEIEAALERFEDAINDYTPRELGSVPVELARFGNEYIQRNEPWKLVEEEPDRAEQVIRDCVQLARAIAVVMQPTLPGKAAALWDQLELEGSVADAGLEAALETPPGTFGEPEALFEEIEDERVETLEADLEARVERTAAEEAETDAGGESHDAAPTDPEAGDADEPAAASDRELEPVADEHVDFETFQSLDIRVGRIESADPIEGADDLLRLAVDIGVETRQIVAGLRQLHDVESLPGTDVVVVANLEPAELFGVESNGMVLAAGEEADLLTTHEGAPPGTRIR